MSAVMRAVDRGAYRAQVWGWLGWWGESALVMTDAGGASSACNAINACFAGNAGKAGRACDVSEAPAGMYGFCASERRRRCFDGSGVHLASADRRRRDRDDPPPDRLETYEGEPFGRAPVKSR